MATIKTLKDVAKSKVNIDGWEPYLYESARNGVNYTVIVTGCMATVKTRGKNKGQLKWDKKNNKITVIISKEEMQ